MPYFDCRGLLVSLASIWHGLLEFMEMIFAFFKSKIGDKLNNFMIFFEAAGAVHKPHDSI